MQPLDRHGVQTFLVQRIGCGRGGRAKDRLKTFVAEHAGQFNQHGAFAGTGQATESGEAVGTGEDVGQSFALVLTEPGRRLVTLGHGGDGLDAGVDRADQEQFFGENLPRRILRANPHQVGILSQFSL